jgi:integrase
MRRRRLVNYISSHTEPYEGATFLSESSTYRPLVERRQGFVHIFNRSRAAALEVLHEAERLSGIEPVPGRGWCGIRRRATDFAEDVEKDERVLDSLSGHTDSATRRKRYQAHHRPDSSRKPKRDPNKNAGG